MAVAISNRQRAVPVSPARLARAANRALAAVGRAAGDADVLVVDDAEIRRLNTRHRGVARRTDVLAFPLEAPGVAAPLVGQIVISAETAARQAHRLDVPLATELDLLVTHGVLHLVGYDDRDPVEAALMHGREREILETGRRRLPAQLWQGLLEDPPTSQRMRQTPRSRLKRARRSRVKRAPRSRLKRATRSRVKRALRSRLARAMRSRAPRSRLAPMSGHPRNKPASRTPLQ
jgi:probable rRNA maturation factor